MVNEELKNIATLLSNLVTLQQEGTNVSKDDFHAITIINKRHIDFLPKSVENKKQRFKWSDIDENVIEMLAVELLDKIRKDKHVLINKTDLKFQTPLVQRHSKTH